MLGVRVTFTADTASWLTDGTADWFWPQPRRRETGGERGTGTPAAS